MTPAVLVGALCHLVFHAVIKICAFFCAGAVIHQTKKEYVWQLNGMGRKLPLVFGAFTVSSLALMGVPGLCGFVSKWYLADAAASGGSPMMYAGVGALLISALLTATYMLTIVVRAFFTESEDPKIETYHDPRWQMLAPIAVFVVAMLIFGLYSGLLVDFFGQVAGGSL